MIKHEHEWPVDRWRNCGTFSGTRWSSLHRGAGLSFNCSTLPFYDRKLKPLWLPVKPSSRLEFWCDWLTQLRAKTIWLAHCDGHKVHLPKHFCVPLFPSKIKPLAVFCTSHLSDEYHLLARLQTLVQLHYNWVRQFQSSFWNRVMRSALATLVSMN